MYDGIGGASRGLSVCSTRSALSGQESWGNGSCTGGLQTRTPRQRAHPQTRHHHPPLHNRWLPESEIRFITWKIKIKNRKTNQNIQEVQNERFVILTRQNSFWFFFYLLTAICLFVSSSLCHAIIILVLYLFVALSKATYAENSHIVLSSLY